MFFTWGGSHKHFSTDQFIPFAIIGHQAELGICNSGVHNLHAGIIPHDVRRRQTSGVSGVPSLSDFEYDLAGHLLALAQDGDRDVVAGFVGAQGIGKIIEVLNLLAIEFD